MHAPSRKVAILTGGGDVPGLNAAIRSFVLHANEAGVGVVGLRRGWEALVRIIPDKEADNSRWIIPLDAANTRTIDRSGGTFLHTTRMNPSRARLSQVPPHLASVAGEQDSDGRYDLTDHALRTIEFLGIEGIVVIGGDGTLAFARRLDQEGVPLIAIPKTLDNDVFGTDYCIGFSTAITRSVAFINDLRTAAGSHERLVVVELFGRYSGETCLLTAYLANTDRAAIAEVPFDVERLYALLEHDRAENPSGYAILAISEGARPSHGGYFERGQPDVNGNRRLGGVGEYVSDYFERLSGERVIYQRLAYLMRSGAPDSLDQLVAKNYGRLAAELLVRREMSRMVALVDGRYASVGIQITGKQRKVVDVARAYDSEQFRLREGNVLGMPMFHP